MPIYEFRCTRCGHEFERLQKLSDPDPQRCPHCRAAAIVHLISPVGFRLKGSGWYETDFKSSGRHNVVETEKPAEANDKKEAGAKNDTGAKKEKGKEAGPKPAGAGTDRKRKVAREGRKPVSEGKTAV